MEIFEPIVADGFEWLNCVDDDDYEALLEMGEPGSKRDWTPIHVRSVPMEPGARAAESDFPWLGSHAIVFSERAKSTLAPLMKDCAEFLPLHHETGRTLVVANASSVDALDQASSKVIMFPGTDRIMRIAKLALEPSKLVGKDFFRLPHRAASTYVSSRFVDAVAREELKGLDFRRVWSSEG